MSTAGHLLIGFGLSTEDAWPLMVGWNERCLPPRDLGELRVIFDWIAARPGTRGGKLLQGGPRRSNLTAEEKLLLDHVQLDIILPEWTLHIDGPNRSWMPPLPKEPLFTSAEMRIFDPAEIHTTVAEALARDERGPGPDDDDDDDDDEGDDDYPNTIPDPSINLDPIHPTGYRYQAGPNCTCTFCILQQHAAARGIRCLRVPGRRWDCPSCGPRRKQHYQDTVTHWLTEWAAGNGGMDEPSLWTATPLRSIWRVIGSSIRIKKGQFFKIDHQAMGSIPGESFCAVSTIRTRHTDWTPITPRQAIDLLHEVIQAFHSNLRVRVWWSSRRWPLLPDRPIKETPWVNVHRLKSSWRAIMEVIEAWGLKMRSIRADGRWWPASGIQGHYPPGSWPDLMDDLCHGAPLSILGLRINDDDELTTIELIDAEGQAEAG